MKQMEINLTRPGYGHGLSLIELMVALAISSILLLGVTTVYTASKRSYQVNTEVAELQENARFALHSLNREIRMAGYTGCQNLEGLDINVNSTNAPVGFDINNNVERFSVFNLSSFITGHRNGNPAFDDDPGNVVPNTDAVTIRKVSACASRVTAMADKAAPITVVGDCNYNAGDIVLITDCTKADMFTITGVNPVGNDIILSHAQGPQGNVSDNLSGEYNIGEENIPRIIRIESSTYYIGFDGANDLVNNRGLYEHRLINNVGLVVYQRRLLIPNVQDMVINYALDINGDPLHSADTLMDARLVNGFNVGLLGGDRLQNETSAWARVNRVNIRMLMFSEAVGQGAKPNQPFLDINGNDVANPGDRRYRRTFNTAINLRNRTP